MLKKMLKELNKNKINYKVKNAHCELYDTNIELANGYDIQVGESYLALNRINKQRNAMIHSPFTNSPQKIIKWFLTDDLKTID